jgi:hypothetical protein
LIRPNLPFEILIQWEKEAERAHFADNRWDATCKEIVWPNLADEGENGWLDFFVAINDLEVEFHNFWWGDYNTHNQSRSAPC